MSEYSANHIMLIDDEAHVFLKRFFTAVYPESTVVSFPSLEDAQDYLDSLDGTGLPDAIITDCTNNYGSHGEMGIDNGTALSEWYSTKAPSETPPTFIFISKDTKTARDTAKHLKDTIGLDALAGSTNEIRKYKNVAAGRNEIFSRRDDNNGMRDFINKTADLNMPVTQDEIDAAMIAQGDIDPKNLTRLMAEGKFDIAQGLDLLEETAREAIEENYELEVNIYDIPKDVFPNDTKVHFSATSGLPAHGYAAYSIEDVERLSAEGKKSILILPEYSPEFIAHLRDISGVVILSGEGTGHLKMLLGSHGVSGLFGMEKSGGSNSYSFSDILTVHRVVSPIMGSMRELERYRAREAELYPESVAYMSGDSDDFDFESIDRDLVGNIYTDITAGTPITLDTSEGNLYGVHLEIEEPSYRSYNWLDKVLDLMAEWKKANSIITPAFRANIDTPEQMPSAISMSNGIGLVRTEHLVLGSTEQVSAFKRGVLEQNATAFEELSSLQAKSFKTILSALDYDFPIKVRLIDAPPSEFFTKGERERFAELYGSPDIRGVQLAQKAPELYKAQADAVFSALSEARKSTFTQGGEIPGASGPIEIMIPTVRTAEELEWASSIVRTSAQEHGFNQTDYRFGTMLETLEACDNIEEIARVSDFISIGSNDLTSEILDCNRDDWLKRRQITLESGTFEDPFVTIHDDVLSVIFDAVARARMINPNISIELCGEHASDEASLEKLYSLGLSGVSMRPISQNMQGLRIRSDYTTFRAAQYTNTP